VTACTAAAALAMTMFVSGPAALGSRMRALGLLMVMSLVAAGVGCQSTCEVGCERRADCLEPGLANHSVKVDCPEQCAPGGFWATKPAACQECMATAACDTVTTDAGVTHEQRGCSALCQ